MSDSKPISDATLTIRVIKSFPYRTAKNLVLHSLDLTRLTVRELKERVKNEIIQGKSGWKPYTAFAPHLDAMKLYTKAHGTKTQNLIINMEDKNDELLFRDDGKTLVDYGCEHETEISFFKLADYEEYKKNPEDKW
ncbi:hypothetical protein BDZ91DRAFT_732646 [Kalaharituber pfeilii]|nr:hypothetical protein BDZ91DRAFT_732646 [Kalaharituber pfeilii]